MAENNKEDANSDGVARLERLADRLDNSGVAEYVKLAQNTPRVLWFNFLSGVARGLGFTVGAAIVLAIFYKVLSWVISMNIPYLTELLTQAVEFVQSVATQK